MKVRLSSDDMHINCYDDTGGVFSLVLVSFFSWHFFATLSWINAFMGGISSGTTRICIKHPALSYLPGAEELSGGQCVFHDEQIYQFDNFFLVSRDVLVVGRDARA